MCRPCVYLALIKRTFRQQTIVFIQTKKEAHRMHIVLGLLGVRVGELHGSLTQPQVPLVHSLHRCLDLYYLSTWASECIDVKNYKWRFNPVQHRMLYSCTYMSTVGVKGLIVLKHSWSSLTFTCYSLTSRLWTYCLNDAASVHYIGLYCEYICTGVLIWVILTG